MLTLDHISHRFGKKEILNDVDLTIADGSFTAILGPNGSGKTTMLRLIANLITPSAGCVLIDGKAVSEYPVRQLAQKIAIVRQNAYTDIDFTAKQLVMMGRNPYQRPLQDDTPLDLQIVEQAMRQTKSWHLRDSLPTQLSGGELQRVMIARALAQQTPILLLDEPTSSLDVCHQFESMELLRTINREQGKTILIVLHDLNLALRYCPETILLYNQQLYFHGPTAEALTPKNIATVFSITAIATPDSQLSLQPMPAGQ